MARVLIVGGSDAGISAALRARELDSTVEVTVLLVDAYPNFSICGLPYYLPATSPTGARWRTEAWRSWSTRASSSCWSTGSRRSTQPPRPS
jgi:flavin-dependent dehydrogenase